jgi:hypothetical protein
MRPRAGGSKSTWHELGRVMDVARNDLGDLRDPSAQHLTRSGALAMIVTNAGSGAFARFSA